MSETFQTAKVTFNVVAMMLFSRPHMTSY